MSSYIGNVEAERTTPGNVVDIITTTDGGIQYDLSQDVPGAYEANILVIKNGMVLTPEADYLIDFSIPNQNNSLITFTTPTLDSDNIFVLHRGTGTYNLVPSPRSVTPDSLSENLRTFVLDSFVGNSSDQDFTLTQNETKPSTLIVTLNGIVKQPTGDYTLDNTTSVTKLHFLVVPGTGVIINVLHLGFSSVIRRSINYVTADVIAPNSITTAHLQHNSVNGDKILLDNDQSIRSLLSVAGEVDLIKVSSTDEAVIYDTVSVSPTDVSPTVSGTVDLGTTSKKFKNVNVSNNINIGNDLNVTNDAIIGGDVTITGVLSASGITGTLPVGAIIMYYGAAAPTNYLLCDGSAVPAGTEYDALRALTGTNVPDFRQRVPMGVKGTSGTVGIAESLGDTANGSFQHNHVEQSHAHNTSTSLIVTDSGHTHGSAYSFTVPKHLHSSPTHSHILPAHYHKVSVSHYHTLTIYTDSALHNHYLKYRDLNRGVISGGANIKEVLDSSASVWDGTVAVIDHTAAHSHAGITTGGGNNWGISGTKQTSESAVDGTGTANLLVTEDSVSSNTGYDYGTDQTRGVTGSSTSGNSNTTVSGNTDMTTGLVTNNNTAQSQPYLAVNFIIRAIA